MAQHKTDKVGHIDLWVWGVTEIRKVVHHLGGGTQVDGVTTPQQENLPHESERIFSKTQRVKLAVGVHFLISRVSLPTLGRPLFLASQSAKCISGAQTQCVACSVFLASQHTNDTTKSNVLQTPFIPCQRT